MQKKTRRWGIRAMVGALGLMMAAGTAVAETTLRASHQWPGGKGDARDEMVNIISREVEAANVGLKVQVFPGSSLFKPREQWGAVTKGQLDMALMPLDYAAGRHPQFSATLMPGLVRNHDRVATVNASPFMAEIKRIMADAGAIVLADAWLSGGFASTKGCVTGPSSVKGLMMRAAGPAFEQMLAGAGASITSMPSSEVYTAMQTGVLSAVNTSSESFLSFRLQEQVKCMTLPGDNALWFMYQPVIMSKRNFDRLTPEQQAALVAAGKKAESFFAEKSIESDKRTAEAFKAAGVELVTMSQQDFDDWMIIARETSYKKFAEDVEGGQALLDLAAQIP